MTLRRFSELLNRSIGGEAASSGENLPPEATIGLRNLRELRTLATMVDLMASNNTLRALDVAIQRIKSIELFVAQGNWTQGSLIELVLPEGEQRAWFRQELKAAKQEKKSETRRWRHTHSHPHSLSLTPALTHTHSPTLTRTLSLSPTLTNTHLHSHSLSLTLTLTLTHTRTHSH